MGGEPERPSSPLRARCQPGSGLRRRCHRRERSGGSPPSPPRPPAGILGFHPRPVAPPPIPSWFAAGGGAPLCFPPQRWGKTNLFRCCLFFFFNIFCYYLRTWPGRRNLLPPRLPSPQCHDPSCPLGHGACSDPSPLQGRAHKFGGALLGSHRRSLCLHSGDPGMSSSSGHPTL